MAGVTTALRGAAIVLLLSAVIMPVPVSAASGPRICNRTNELVGLPIAWWSPPRRIPTYVSAGWYRFQPGECRLVFPDESVNDGRYYYANSSGGAGVGGI